jgi:hypothetical protein
VRNFVRRRWRLLLAAAATLAVAGTAWLDAALARSLRSSLDAAAPAIAERTGVTLDVKSLRAGVFRQTLSVRDVRASNPPGFAEPSVLDIAGGGLRLRLGALLRGVTDVPSLRLKGVRFRVIRNAEGLVNLAEIRDASDAYRRAHPPAVEENTGEEGQARLLLRRARAEGVVEYIDHKAVTGEPVTQSVCLRVEAADIATYRRWFGRDGTFRVRGHDADNPEAFVVDLHGFVAPLEDPLKATFQVEGSIAAVDASRLGGLGANATVRSDSASVDIRLRCADGVFDAAKSVVTVKFQNATLSGNMARTTRLRKPLPTLTIAMPIAGTLESPRFDWMGAVSDTLFRDVGKTLDQALSQTGIDRIQGQIRSNDINRVLNDAVRGLGGLFRPREGER